MLQPGGDFHATGAILLIPGGSTNVPGKVILASRAIASGARAFLQRWSAKVTDLGNADQVYFAITRNGTPIQAGAERIPAIQFDFQSQLDLNILLNSGLIEIIGYNISGMSTTIEPGAVADSIAVNAQAWWSGNLVVERGG